MTESLSMILQHWILIAHTVLIYTVRRVDNEALWVDCKELVTALGIELNDATVIELVLY